MKQTIGPAGWSDTQCRREYRYTMSAIIRTIHTSPFTVINERKRWLTVVSHYIADTPVLNNVSKILRSIFSACVQ